MSEAFAQEFAGNIKQQLDLQYRTWKPLMASFFKDDKYDFVFVKRNAALKNLSSINRWFATEQRLMEYMAYHFCGKYYNQLMHQINAD